MTSASHSQPNPDAAPSARGSGRLQLYTGDGKGKTTASLGLLIRAAGDGNPVAFVQFDKGYDPARGEHYAERNVLRAVPRIDLFPFGCERMMPDGKFRFKNAPEDLAEGRAALAKCRELIASRRYFLIVVDEILTSIKTHLVTEEEVLELIALRETASPDTELVLTGRGASQRLIERADLVTEMKPIKHYFDAGLPARKGIEY